MDHVILIRYGEIGLKSSPVRRQFEKKLISNIRSTLERNGIKGFGIYRQDGRIFLKPGEGGDGAILRLLPSVFGITSVSPAVKCESDLKKIEEVVLGNLKDKLSMETKIAVRARRAWKDFPYSSENIGNILGKAILDEFSCKVDLRDPDVEIFVEIRKYSSFTFFEKIPAVCGMPYGTAGRILALIEDGNSAVATWMMMKRGCEVIPVWWEKTKNRYLEVLKSWERVPDGYAKPDDDIIGFLRGIVKEERLLGIVLGDREIEKCNFEFDSNFDIPVYRPLLGLGKPQIAEAEKTFFK